MSSFVSLVKPVQIIRKHWRHLEGLQIGSMQWLDQDLLSVQFETQIFEFCYIEQCGKGLFLFHFFLASLVSSPFVMPCMREL